MQNAFRKMLTISCGRSDPAILSCKCHGKSGKEKPKHTWVSYFLTRYVNLVKKCEDTFPTAAKFYKTFQTGIKGFKDDSLLLFHIYKKLSFDGINCLTRKELEVYHEMPKNIVKVTPFIIGSALPFGAALFAVGCMFPKLTLSNHFWSEEQKGNYALIDHKKKLEHYGPIVSCLEARVKLIKCDKLQHQLQTMLDGLRSGITPTPEEIICCKQLFQEPPYNLSNLGTRHAGQLLKLFNLHRGWRRKCRLHRFAALMKAMDCAIVAEGGLQRLNRSELEWASFFRGLNPINMSDEEIKLWLSNWLKISGEIDESNYSLLLHSPVLLGYNESTNVALVKSYRK